MLQTASTCWKASWTLLNVWLSQIVSSLKKTLPVLDLWNLFGSYISPWSPAPAPLGEADVKCINPKQIRKDTTISYAPFINWHNMEVLKPAHKKVLSFGMKRLTENSEIKMIIGTLSTSGWDENEEDRKWNRAQNHYCACFTARLRPEDFVPNDRTGFFVLARR